MLSWNDGTDIARKIGPELKSATGFSTVMRSLSLPGAITPPHASLKKLACLHPLQFILLRSRPTWQSSQEVTKRIPGVSIQDQTDLLPTLRAKKSPAELDLMRAAISATAAGFLAILKTIRPGISEREIGRYPGL